MTDGRISSSRQNMGERYEYAGSVEPGTWPAPAANYGKAGIYQLLKATGQDALYCMSTSFRFDSG